MFRNAFLPLAAMIAMALPACADGNSARRHVRSRPVDHAAAMDLLGKSFAPRGRNLSFEEASGAFGGIRPKLEAIISVLETCLPKRSSGYGVIWDDDDPDPEAQLHCSIGGSDEPIGRFETMLRAADIVNMSYGRPSATDHPGHIRSASFMIFSVGFAGSGASTSINFDADPVSCTSQKDRDGSLYLEARPLTGPPCEWVWEHDEQ